MRVHSPTSRSGRRIYLSIWDLFWALVSPIVALYLRDIDIQSNADWSVIANYWVLSAGFAIVAFFASLAPALRAAAVDPLIALRDE